MELTTYMNDHPDYILLQQQDPNIELLQWAHAQKYITLVTFGSRTFYTSAMLQTALMWQEKILH